jgi:hypothetical protein
MPRRDAEVERLVRRWLDAKQAADGAEIASALSRYEGALAIGTEAEEWFTGAGPFADAHAPGGPFEADVEHVEAHREGSVAWAAVRARIQTGDPGGLPIRLTLVLVRDDAADGDGLAHGALARVGPRRRLGRRCGPASAGSDGARAGAPRAATA